jgi:protein-L-isoaspartate(D-aspartate) O-methyltransferase
MVKQQLRTGDVLNEEILALFEELPRHEFVPKNMSPFAYSDMQIPLAQGQRMLTPLEEGSILQACQLQGHETVLEIGTGTGFLTALLSRLSRKVISVEYFEAFSETASQHLKKYHCDNVELVTADGSQGLLDGAPYDCIIITGAIEAITETLLLQVVPGGKLFAIVGQDPIMKAMLYSLDHNNQWTKKMLFETCIPPLINAVKQSEFTF